MNFESFEDRIEHIKKSLDIADKIQNSLSNTAPHKNFSNEIDISYVELRKVFDFPRNDILIDYYTFCEQIMKEFVYEILELNSDVVSYNSHVKKYLVKRFPEDRYSPNVNSIKDITSLITRITSHDDKLRIKLIPELSKQRREYHKSLIGARHKYAHNSQIPYFDIYEYVHYNVEFLYLLLTEVKNLILNFDIRIRIQVDYDELFSVIDKILTSTNNEPLESKKINIRKLKENSENLLIEINKLNDEYNSYKKLKDLLMQIKKIDRRYKYDSLKKQIEKFFQEYLID